MPCDRTSEFLSTVGTLRSSVSSSRLSMKPPAPLRTAQSTAMHAFSEKATQISVRTKKTIDRLTEMNRLVSQKSLFANSAGDIETLTTLIKRGIEENNGAITQLQLPGGVRGQTKDHTSVVLKSVQQNLLWTTRTFKKVLELRGERMRAHSERVSSYGRMELNFTAPPSMGGGRDAGAGAGAFPTASAPPVSMGLRARRGAGPAARAASSSSGGGGWQTVAAHAPTFGNPGAPPLARRQFEQAPMGMGVKGHGGPTQRLHLAASIPQSSFLENRANEMKKIEGTIGALGSMFSRLSTLIQQQGEEVDLIDNNLEAAEEDVIAAEGELLKYFALVKGNRGLIVKVFLGLAIFSVTMMIIYG